MRIGVNCFLLQAHIGGLKQYFLTLFHELLTHDADNEYIFFWFSHNADELAHLGTDCWKEKAVFLHNQWEIRPHLERLDLYFCPFGALYPRPLSLPTVVTLVDIQEVFYPQFFTIEDRYIRDFHFVGSTRMADRVVTISEFSKKTIVKYHQLSEKKVVTAYLSADERYYRSERIARPPAQPHPRHFIFYPANFWHHKNHDCLLQALRILREEKKLLIDVVFTGFEESNGYPLASKAEEYGVRQQMHVLGYVPVEELAYLYCHARMLVFPSLFEGFGIPLVEAMAVGCPVVAANATSIPEIAAGAAELFDPTSPYALAQAIEQVWHDDTLQHNLIAQGKRRAQDFSPAKTAQAHLSAFGEAAQTYSYPRFLWQQWIYRYYHRARVEFRWRQHRGVNCVREWATSRGWRLPYSPAQGHSDE
jgi:glycosyltransferase involved in cell wall biosynthesis